MKESTRSVAVLLVLVLCAAAALLGQDTPPDQPFKTLHLIALPPDVTENAWVAALSDVNQAIVKAGCQTCIYHVFKVYGQKEGNYTHLQEASWPGRAVYEKIHAAPEYTAARKRHPELDKVGAKQVYNRYVELGSTKK